MLKLTFTHRLYNDERARWKVILGFSDAEICSDDKDEEWLEESVSGNTDEVEAWLSLSPLLHVWDFWFSFSLPSNMFVNDDDET